MGSHFWDLVPIVLLGLLFFGPKRLPEMGASIGKTIKSFQHSMRDVTAEPEAQPALPASNAATATPTLPTPATTATAVTAVTDSTTAPSPAALAEALAPEGQAPEPVGAQSAS